MCFDIKFLFSRTTYTHNFIVLFTNFTPSFDVIKIDREIVWIYKVYFISDLQYEL